MLVEQRQNSFGLGMKYIACRKASVQPKYSESMTARGLSPILQNSEGSEQSDRATDEWIDPRFVVVFAKDGDTLGSCKSFKMNIQEILNKYKVKKPAYMKTLTSEHKELKERFEKRAYKELLEYCADHLFNQAQETDPARR